MGTAQKLQCAIQSLKISQKCLNILVTYIVLRPFATQVLPSNSCYLHCTLQILAIPCHYLFVHPSQSFDLPRTLKRLDLVELENLRPWIFDGNLRNLVLLFYKSYLFPFVVNNIELPAWFVPTVNNRSIDVFCHAWHCTQKSQVVTWNITWKKLQSIKRLLSNGYFLTYLITPEQTLWWRTTSTSRNSLYPGPYPPKTNPYLELKVWTMKGTGVTKWTKTDTIARVHFIFSTECNPLTFMSSNFRAYAIFASSADALACGEIELKSWSTTYGEATNQVEQRAKNALKICIKVQGGAIKTAHFQRNI